MALGLLGAKSKQTVGQGIILKWKVGSPMLRLTDGLFLATSICAGLSSLPLKLPDTQ